MPYTKGSAARNREAISEMIRFLLADQSEHEILEAAADQYLSEEIRRV